MNSCIIVFNKECTTADLIGVENMKKSSTMRTVGAFGLGIDKGIMRF